MNEGFKLTPSEEVSWNDHSAEEEEEEEEEESCKIITLASLAQAHASELRNWCTTADSLWKMSNDNTVRFIKGREHAQKGKEWGEQSQTQLAKGGNK